MTNTDKLNSAYFKEAGIGGLFSAARAGIASGASKLKPTINVVKPNLLPAAALTGGVGVVGYGNHRQSLANQSLDDYINRYDQYLAAGGDGKTLAQQNKQETVQQEDSEGLSSLQLAGLIGVPTLGGILLYDYLKNKNKLEREGLE